MLLNHMTSPLNRFYFFPAYSARFGSWFGIQFLLILLSFEFGKDPSVELLLLLLTHQLFLSCKSQLLSYLSIGRIICIGSSEIFNSFVPIFQSCVSFASSKETLWVLRID